MVTYSPSINDIFRRAKCDRHHMLPAKHLNIKSPAAPQQEQTSTHLLTMFLPSVSLRKVMQVVCCGGCSNNCSRISVAACTTSCLLSRAGTGQAHICKQCSHSSQGSSALGRISQTLHQQSQACDCISALNNQHVQEDFTASLCMTHDTPDQTPVQRLAVHLGSCTLTARHL